MLSGWHRMQSARMRSFLQCAHNEIALRPPETFMRIEQLTCALGAELVGVSLADAVGDDGLFADIKADRKSVV